MAANRLKTVQMPTGCVEIHGHCATYIVLKLDRSQHLITNIERRNKDLLFYD